jgi:hypothetical protein
MNGWAMVFRPPGHPNSLLASVGDRKHNSQRGLVGLSGLVFLEYTVFL